MTPGIVSNSKRTSTGRRATALKACFPFAAGNPKTDYGIQLGDVERDNDNEKKYEFPHHQWIDLTDASGKFGASLLDDSKFGSDKPDDHTVRLTLIYTPGVRSGSTQDQASQDIGRHSILYAVTSHADDWKAARTPLVAQRLNQPLLAFAVPSHAGELGKMFSLASVSSDHVVISAIKKAEDSDEIIVRLKEIIGAPAEKVHVKFASPVVSAREVDGQEREIGKADAGDELVTDMGAFRLRTFAVKLGPAKVQASATVCQSVDLPFDSDVVSTDANRADGSFDSEGRTYPAEQLPPTITAQGVEFKLGPTADGQKNAVTCRSQSIAIPSGEFDRAYILASADGDQNISLDVGGKSVPLTIQNWSGFVGQWDNRQWLGDVPELASQWHNELGGLVPGFVKPASVAWFATHRHHPTNGNEPYQFSYLFEYPVDLPSGTTSIKLPENDHVKVFAISVVKNDPNRVPLQPLHDSLADHVANDTPTASIEGKLDDAVTVTLHNPLYWHVGGLHYTLDGAEPTEQSPVYENPLAITSPVTLKAKMFLSSDEVSPTLEQKLDVHDVTPPTVKSVLAFEMSPTIFLTFSEPIDASAAETTSNYSLSPEDEIQSAKLQADGKTVALSLSRPLAGDAASTLVVKGVKDLAGNVIAQQNTSIVPLRPVYRQADDLTGPGDVTSANLPVHGSDPWTINLMLKIAKQPPNRTLIAGFGAVEDTSGHGRYLAKFGNGIHFWASHHDGESTTQLDLNKWQMLTATYDGQTVRMYKNAELIGQMAAQFEDDDSSVHVRPIEPWDKSANSTARCEG